LDRISINPTHILFVLVAIVIVSFSVFYPGVDKVYSQDPLFDPNDLPQGQPLIDDLQPIEDQAMGENQSSDEFSIPGFDDSSSGNDSSSGDSSNVDTGSGSGGGSVDTGSGSGGGSVDTGSGTGGGDATTDNFAQMNSLPNGTRLVVNMSNSTGDSINAQFAVSGNRIYAIWQEVTAGGNDVVQIRSVDSGITYEKLQHVSTATGKSSNPSIAVSGNTVYAVWTQLSDDGSYGIFFTRSLDGGGTYEKEKQLATTLGEAPYAKLVVFGNATYVVWTQPTDIGTHEIFFTRSLNGGADFNEPVNVSNNPGDSLSPQVSAFNGSVYVVWTDDSYDNAEILVSKSTSNGDSFEKAINVSNNPGESLNPQIFTSRGRISVVWEDATPSNGANNDILFARSNSTAVNFDEPVNVSNNPGQSLNPTVAASGATVYVAWRDSSQAANNEIYLARSINNGATFGNFTNLSNTTGDSTGQSLAASNTNVYIAWSDRSLGNADIIFIKSNNYGATFEKTKNLSNNPEESIIPHISLIGDREYILWRDETVASRAEVKLTDKASSAVDFTGQSGPAGSEMTGGFPGEDQSGMTGGFPGEDQSGMTGGFPGEDQSGMPGQSEDAPGMAGQSEDAPGMGENIPTP
jgi:hypothetical protein